MIVSVTRKHLLFTTAITLALSPVTSLALPTGSSVSSGTATISNTATQTTVNQTSSKAVINWTGFNTANGETVQINDPSSSSITLNRVSGGMTNFNGALNSNGNVWVINPNGILIGSTGKVNTNSFLATTSAITDTNFMNGTYNFTPGGAPSNPAAASVGNAGSITVANAGLAALVGPTVANSGTITAQAGKITLASGDSFTVDLAGDGLINLSASKAITQQAISNFGTLNAQGGTVVITAAQASNVLDNLINLDGLVVADSVTASNQSGDLEYGANFIGSIGGNVTLSAYRNVSIDSKTTIAPGPISGKLNITIDANDTNAGAGSITLGSGSSINSNGGDIVLGGGTNPLTGYATGDAASAVGVYVDGASVNAAGGNITIHGRGYGAATGAGYGVYNNAGTISTNGSGTVSIVGLGGSTGSYNGYGVFNTGTIESQNGSIAISAVGSSKADRSAGYVSSGSHAIVEATGSGNIGVSGRGGSFKGTDYGIAADGVSSSTAFSTASGNITLSGVGGGQNSSYYLNDGIYLNNATVSTLSGNIILSGTAGTGSASLPSYGIHLLNGSKVTTPQAGSITFDSVSPVTTALYTDNSANLIGSGTDTGAIRLVQDTLALGSQTEIATGGHVTISPYTAATTIGFSGGAGTLQVTQAVVNQVNAPVLVVGRLDSTATLSTGAFNWNPTNNALYLEGGNDVIGGNFAHNVVRPYGTVNIDSLYVDAATNIALNDKTSISGNSSSAPINVTFEANDRNSGAGSIYVGDTSLIATNGGNITLGGTTNPLAGYAFGDNAAGTTAIGNSEYANGIYLNGSTLNATGATNSGTGGSYNGNIVLNGEAPLQTSSIPNGEGVRVDNSPNATPQLVTSGTGTIKVNGIAQAAPGGDSLGVDIEEASLQTQGGAIAINGTSGNATVSTGVNLVGDSIGSSSGAISITGNGLGGAISQSQGVNLTNGTLSNGSGTITITGKTAAGNASEDTGVNVGYETIASKTGTVNITGISDLNTTSTTGVLLGYGTSLVSTGSASNAATFNINGTGSGLGIVAEDATFSTVNGNFYFKGINNETGTPILIQDSQFNSTGTGTFNFNPGAIVSE